MVTENGFVSEPRLKVGDVLLPIAAVTAAVAASFPAFHNAWMTEWRTGILFALSAVLIIAGQAFLTQYFAVRSLRNHLLARVRRSQDKADGLIAAIEAANSERQSQR
jgi:hypothetical protein